MTQSESRGKMPGVRRGLEALLSCAAADPRFCERLIEHRSSVAPEVGITLAPSETAMLEGVTAARLRQLVRSIPIDQRSEQPIIGRLASVLVATLAVPMHGCNEPAVPDARPGVSVSSTPEVITPPDQETSAAPAETQPIDSELPAPIVPGGTSQPQLFPGKAGGGARADMPPDRHLPRVEIETRTERAEGLPSAAVVVTRMRPGFGRCCVQGLAAGRHVTGEARLGARIGSGGEVTNVDVKSHGQVDADVVACWVARVRSGQFDPPESGSATFDVVVTARLHPE